MRADPDMTFKNDKLLQKIKATRHAEPAGNSAEPPPYEEEELRSQAGPDQGAKSPSANADQSKTNNSEQITIGGILTMARAMPDPELVAEPFSVRGQLVTLTAKPNHGKSTFSLAHAVHHVLQMPFGPIRPRSDGTAVYVSAEDQESTGVRAQAQCAALGLTSEQISTVDRKLRWATLNAPVTIGEVVERIRADTKGAAIDIVYVDTGIAMFAGDDENDNIQLQVFATSCRELTRLPGRPWVALMWHPVKGANNAAALQPRGGSSLNGTIDGNLTLWAEDDATELHYLKARWPRFEPIKFALKPFPLELSSGKWIDIPLASRMTDEADEERGDARTQRREKLLLAMTSSTKPLSLRQLQLAAGAGKSTVDRDFKAMSEAKPALVRFDTVNDRYTLTEAGIKRAAAIRKRDVEGYRNAQDPG